jgi:adenylate kinase family enzyme
MLSCWTKFRVRTSQRDQLQLREARFAVVSALSYRRDHREERGGTPRESRYPQYHAPSDNVYKVYKKINASKLIDHALKTIEKLSFTKSFFFWVGKIFF